MRSMMGTLLCFLLFFVSSTDVLAGDGYICRLTVGYHDADVVSEHDGADVDAALLHAMESGCRELCLAGVADPERAAITERLCRRRCMESARFTAVHCINAEKKRVDADPDRVRNRQIMPLLSLYTVRAPLYNYFDAHGVPLLGYADRGGTDRDGAQKSKKSNIRYVEFSRRNRPLMLLKPSRKPLMKVK